MTESARHSGSPVAAGVAAAIVVLLFAAAAVAALTAWNTHADPVFAMHPHTVLGSVSQRLYWPAYYNDEHAPRDAWVVRLAAATGAMGDGRYPAIMAAQTLLMAAAVLLMAALAGYLAGPFAAVTAAGVASALPYWWMDAVGFDDHLFNLVLLIVALLLTAVAFRTPRRIRALVLGGVAGVVAALMYEQAFVPSTGLLAVVVFATGTLGLLADIGAENQVFTNPSASTIRRVYRTRIAVGAVMLACLLATVVLRRFTAGVYWEYYAREVSNLRAQPVTLLQHLGGLAIYTLQAADTDWGPVIAAAVFAGTVLAFARKAPGRYFATAWWLPTLIILSVVPKKNAYYTTYALAGAPLAVAMGVNALTGARARVAAATVVIAAAWGLTAAWYFGALEHHPLPESLLVRFQETPFWYPRRPEHAETEEIVTARDLTRLTAEARPDACPRLIIAPPSFGPLHFTNRLMYLLTANDHRVAWVELTQAWRLPFEDPAPFLLIRDDQAAEYADPGAALSAAVTDLIKKATPITRSGVGLYIAALMPTGRFVEAGRTGRFILYRFDRGTPVVSCPDLAR